ncbi:zinc knuckle CX2CX4HX4C containing protein [Tanacetum coccineum]
MFVVPVRPRRRFSDNNETTSKLNGCHILSPLKKLCPQSLGRNLCSGCKVGEKVRIDSYSIWVKLHDVPIQVFERMLHVNDSWGRSSFARCLIEVNSEADLVDVVTIGIPSLSEDDFTKETIRVEYEWRPPRCDTCKIFGHVHDYCPKKVKKRKGKSKSTNGGQFTGHSVKHNVRYEPKATTSAPKKGTTYVGYTSQSTPMLKTTGNSSKKDNLSMSNSFSALNEEEEEDVEMCMMNRLT